MLICYDGERSRAAVRHARVVTRTRAIDISERRGRGGRPCHQSD